MNEFDHIQESLRFLQHAELFTAPQDDLAKSEMLWCAAAHSVKAFAVQRGWRNHSHNDLFVVADKINAEIGYGDADAHFSSAASLHNNMYRRFMNRRRMAAEEAKVIHFVNRIANAVSAHTPDGETPPA